MKGEKMSGKTINHKELILTEKEQRILESCAVYIPKKAIYNVNGEIDKNVEKIDEIKGELRDVQKGMLDSKMKRDKITELERCLSDAEDKRKISEKNFCYMAFEVYKQNYMPTSRKDTFWRNVKDIDKILSKSSTFNRLISNDRAIREELIILYTIFICVMPSINHNHQEKIKWYNEKIAKNPYYVKEKTPPKVVSQLKYDIDKTEYCFEKENYSKGQYLFQNYQEIEADRSLFDCLMDALKIIKESNKIESFINKMVQRVLLYSLDRGIKNVSNFETENNLLLFKDNPHLKVLDEIIKNWSKDQDLLVRKIILELFDLKIVPEIAEAIIHDPEKMKDMDLFYLRVEEMSEADLIAYIDQKHNQLEKAHIEDKLSCLGVIDSYFKKVCERKRNDLWKP